MLGSTSAKEPSKTGVFWAMNTASQGTMAARLGTAKDRQYVKVREKVHLAARRERLTCQLRARRNAVCEEIEKGIRIGGTSLLKRRKNFSVTHRLTAMGLMW